MLPPPNNLKIIILYPLFVDIMGKDKNNQLIINFIRPIYVFEYYLANGMVDYIVITLGLIFGSIFNVFSSPIAIPNYNIGGFDVVGIILGLIITIVLVIEVFIWPLTDILLMLFLPHYALLIGGYIVIKLIMMIFYHDDLYFTVMDYVEDIISHFKEILIEDTLLP